MQTMQRRSSEQWISKRDQRRFGYALAIGINLVMVWVVYNILDWGWPPFITSEWDRVVDIVALSMIAAILANAAYLAFDPRWFKRLTDAATGVVGVIASARVLSVFPFDFSNYTGPWETLSRIVLIIAIVGSAIGVLVNLAMAARGA